MSLANDHTIPASWRRGIRRPDHDAPVIITPGCMNGRRWSQRDISTVQRLAGKVPAEEIAAQLGRSAYAVEIRAWASGLTCRMPKKSKRPVREIDEAMAKAVFARCYPSMRAIIRQVSEETGISIPAMLCRQRHRPIVKARQLLFWTLARDLKFSLAQMATQLGRDHTTLRCAIMKIDRERGTSVMSLRSLAKLGRVA